MGTVDCSSNRLAPVYGSRRMSSLSRVPLAEITYGHREARESPSTLRFLLRPIKVVYDAQKHY